MKINLIGVPLFYGCDKKGVELGPDELRNKGLLEILEKNHKVKDLGNINVEIISEDNKFTSNNKMKYLSAIQNTSEALAKDVYNSLSKDEFPLVVGGDHSLALGSVAGAGKYFGQDYGVIWIDAHGDINTDSTSPSGNVHGMPLAASMGIGNNALTNLYYNDKKVDLDKVFIFAARDLDQGELKLIEENKLNVWTIKDIKTKGLETCFSELLEKIKNINNIHLSFDIDSIDPMYIPGTGTPVENGLTVKEAQNILKDLLKTKKIKSLDFVEFNPKLDDTDTTLNNCLAILNTISNNL